MYQFKPSTPALKHPKPQYIYFNTLYCINQYFDEFIPNNKNQQPAPHKLQPIINQFDTTNIKRRFITYSVTLLVNLMIEDKRRNI